MGFRSTDGKAGRNGSLSSLTISQVQAHLGGSLHAMNLDDLLRSLFPAADHRRLFAIDLESARHQRSSTSLTAEIGKKTVDQVWRDIQRETNDGQPSLGEMTLEDFLARAAEVSDETHGIVDSDPLRGFSSSFPWLQEHRQEDDARGSAIGADVAVPRLPELAGTTDLLPVCSNPDAPIAMLPPPVFSGTRAPGRKRVANGDGMEKTVERKQKRMIKNRESAARSRARKQAYTHELENKILRLEEENEMLKQQKELDRLLLYDVPPPDPKRRLRRTASAPL